MREKAAELGDDGVEDEGDDEPCVRKGRRVADRAAKDAPAEVSKKAAKPKGKAKAKPAAKPKGKAKAKPAAKAKGKAKAKPAAKAKGKAKATPDARAKAKRSAKGKAKASKTDEKDNAETKAKKAKTGTNDVCVEEGIWNFFGTSDASQLKDQMVDFARIFDGSEFCMKTKNWMKSELWELQTTALSIYWTRPAVGVQRKSDAKELGYLSMARCPSDCSWPLKMAVLLKAAEMLGYYVDCLVWKGCEEESMDVSDLKDLLKEQVLAALEELAS